MSELQHYMTMNGVASTGNYNYHRITGSGASPVSAMGTTFPTYAYLPLNDVPANTASASMFYQGVIDILDYKVKPESHDVIIALGSINFNSKDEIEARFSHCVNLLEKGGRFYLRANPGIAHKTGPYVDIFPWSFEIVNEFAEKFNLKLLEFKKDANNRLYFVYQKTA